MDFAANVNPNTADDRLSTGRAVRLAAVMGVLGLAVSLLLGPLAGWERFFRAYIVSYAFVLSLALGSLFFVLLHYLTRAGWSVVVRRLAEIVAAVMPLLAVLFAPLLIPLFLGLPGVYAWSDRALVQTDANLQLKQVYLNVPFFAARWVVYFTVWIYLSRRFLSASLAQDQTADVELSRKLERASAPGMLAFGFTLTFAAFDLLMSLSPHWFSTVFGVYYFSGGVLGSLALLIILAVIAQRHGALQHAVTPEHFHDLGKLAFAFVVFWAYIAYSQYMLIWYANMPEETAWYQPRNSGGWAWLGIVALLFAHFVVPFLALVSRYPKRRPGLLAIAAVWLLLVHWVDLYWVAMPALGIAGGNWPPNLVDLTLLIGVGGIFAAGVAVGLGRYPLLARGDPRLPESLAFEEA